MNEFIEHLTELFTDFGPIRSRRMFGGYGIYHNELMFGLVADDVLFLKTDKALAHEMSEMGLEPSASKRATRW